LPTVPPRGNPVAGTTPFPLAAPNVPYSIPGATSAGFDAISFTMSPRQSVGPNDEYFWAFDYQFNSNTTDQFYFGLQPDGSSPNGSTGKLALFSIFGPGISSTSPYCVNEADGGAGTGCQIPYQWTLGHIYTFTVTVAQISSTTITWEGNVFDDNTGAQTTIADISVPASLGLLAGNPNAFDEFYLRSDVTCLQQTQSEILFFYPVAYLHGVAFRGSIAGLWANNGCNLSFYSDQATYAYIDAGY
jgi:hypothetical protein